MWNYNDDEGLWEGEDAGYSYDPFTDQFMLHGNHVEMGNMPLNIRQNLEYIAWDRIFQIIKNVNPINQGDAVEFTNKFNQGGEIVTVQLNNEIVFGSAGASPCLIIFSVGWSEGQNSFYSKGAHRDNASNPGNEFLDDMTNNPNGTEWNNVRLYIVGGEVGSHRES